MSLVKMVALIPARAGSKRIPGKNTKLLAGHPLIAYTIAAAQQSGVFSEVWVSSEDAITRGIALACGANTSDRLVEHARDDSPDIDWVRETLAAIGSSLFDSFAILRPTSPFRTAATIRRAYDQFKRSEVHSIRAVELAKQNPYKMWTWAGPGMPIMPLIEQHAERPLHSMPSQCIPQAVWIQNASLEMAWTYVVKSVGTIAGRKVGPFFTDCYEGFDINTPADWAKAEILIEEGLVELPSLPLARI